MPWLVYTLFTNVPLLLFRNQWTLAFSILDAVVSYLKRKRRFTETLGEAESHQR